MTSTDAGSRKLRTVRVRGNRRSVGAIIVGSSVALAIGGFVIAPAASQAATGPTVSSFLTTPDRSKLLSPVADTTFSSDASSRGQTITVDPSKTYQTMDGFGASITDSSAHLLYQLSADQRNKVMRSVFDPTDGIGMSFLRQPLGSSDYVDGAHYTYDDLPAGQSDYSMSKFSIGHDTNQIIPLLKQAISLNPKLKVMVTPWGQPAWMKQDGNQFGDKLKDDPRVINAYALYLVKSLQAYKAQGVPVYALTVQNEPQNRKPDGYPGTDMDVATEASVINALGPALADAGLSGVKIIGYDHNWAQFPGDGPKEPDYPYQLLRTPAAKYIAGVAYHCYAGDPTAQSKLHDAFPDKDIWFTECSGFRGTNDSQEKAFSDTLSFHAKNVTIGSTRNWAKSAVNWNLALDDQGKPNNGGCGRSPDGVCTGAVAINGTSVRYNAEYYNLGHMSKFVVPGAKRIDSNDIGGVENVAFANPDGSIALVVHNSGGGSTSFGVKYNGKSLAYTLPAGGLATLTWPGGDKPTPAKPAPATPTIPAATPTTPTPTPAKPTTPTPAAKPTPATPKPTPAEPAPATPAPTAPAATPTASAPSTPSKSYWVINTNSGKCIDDTDFGTGDGSRLQQWKCNSPKAKNQQWTFTPTSDGYYRVTSLQAPLVWDVTNGAGAVNDGDTMQLWSNVDGANQQWRTISLGNGVYSFQARNSGKCLDVRDLATNDGAPIQQWTCHGGPAQRFELR